jgi:uncharacterized protein YecT (DUF1311 family)
VLRFTPFFALLMSGFGATALPVSAASFDCDAATTAMEFAICGDAALGAADETLAVAYQTAIGGLTKGALAQVRQDQRAWLAYAEQVCITSDGAPTGIAGRAECLLGEFDDRIDALEIGGMKGGYRFYPVSHYAALPDPNYADEPDSAWRLARHSFTDVRMDGDRPVATAFNAMIDAIGAEYDRAGDGDPQIGDDTSTTAVELTVTEALAARISLEETTYWYGHGAAHGNYTISYRHFMVSEGRPLEASDLFAAPDWQDQLAELAVAQLDAEHGDALFGDHTADSIRDTVTNPLFWSFEGEYGLVIRFQPYEVAAYAYGAPTITIGWDALDPLLADTADAVRWGN